MLLRDSDLKAEEIRRLRQADQTQRAAMTKLSANFDEATRALQSRDLEIAKLQHKIDVQLLFVSETCFLQ